MIAASRPTRPRRRRLDGAAAIFAAGTLILTLLGIDLAGYWLKAGTRRDETTAATALAGHRLEIPGAWLVQDGRQDAAERIDLVIPWSAVAAGLPGGFHVTAAAAGSAPSRPAQLYGRFLTAVARSHPSGLLERRFREGTLYENETLYLAISDRDAFGARCLPEDAVPEPVAACLATVGVGPFDLRVRFASERLGEWEAMLALLRRTFAGRGPAAAAPP